uniref:Putative secreted protein n=1 Tax=Anopheles darlingi TaxID=43151 RepID=A0A2M4D5E1_ANODA
MIQFGVKLYVCLFVFILRRTGYVPSNNLRELSKEIHIQTNNLCAPMSMNYLTTKHGRSIIKAMIDGQLYIWHIQFTNKRPPLNQNAFTQ